MPDGRLSRKPLISGNWKMHHNHFEAIQRVQKLSYQLSDEDYEAVDVSVHPPFTDLRSVQTVIDADKHPDPPRRAALPLGGPRARSPARSRPRCWPSSTCAT